MCAYIRGRRRLAGKLERDGLEKGAGGDDA